MHFVLDAPGIPTYEAGVDHDRPRPALPRLALAAALAALASVPAAAQPLLPRLVGRVAPASQLAGCDRADERITVNASTHLDPTCTYTKGFEVEASNVVLDCRGALVEGADLEGRGISIRAPADVPLANVVVRNCFVRGFQNGIRVTRQGFKDLLPGEEYGAAFSGIRLENIRVSGTRASGIFVDGYVTGVTIRRVEVAGAGSVGIYLEAGSKDNVVMRCDIHDNGYGDVDPAGVPIVVGSVTFRYLSTGREGIAVDGSRDNRILRNRIAGNSAGGIFLYKNCGEDMTTNGWWPRRYGADGNLIARNEIADAPNGVWIASRASQNQYFMDCSDPAYVTGGLTRIHEEFAKDNVVRRNTFANVAWGVRVEDDGNHVDRNRFVSSDPSHQALLLGTKYRTEVLGRPVAGTVARGNLAEIAGNAAPYGWIHGHAGTLFTANRSNGVVVELQPAVPPPLDPFLFAKEFWVEGS